MNVEPLQIPKRLLRFRRATEVYALTCYGCHRTVELSTHDRQRCPRYDIALEVRWSEGTAAVA